MSETITAVGAAGAPAEGAKERHFYRWELDVLRVAAFMLVFCQHALPQHAAAGGRPADFLTTLSYSGGFGVRLFFVLSAYLLTRLLLIEYRQVGTIAVKSFYLRRTLRIWPLYFAFVIVCIPIANGGAFIIPGIEPGHLVGTLTFTLNWFQGLQPPSTTSASGILWSLAVEEQMYLVWPLMMVWLLRRGRLSIGLVGLAALGVVGRVVIAGAGLHYPAIWVLTPSAFDAFAVGGLLAVASERFTLRMPVATRAGLLIGALLGLLAMTWAVGISVYSGWTAVWSYLVVTGLCAAALMAAIGNTDRSIDPPRRRSSRILVWAGRRSYGLYVWHRLAIAAVVASFSATHVNELRLFPVALVLTVLMAWTSYSILERPFLRLKERRARVASAPV